MGDIVIGDVETHEPAFEHENPEGETPKRHWASKGPALAAGRHDVETSQAKVLTNEHALAYEVFRASAKLLEQVTLKAKADIELAQQRYRDALTEFTRLSVASEA